MENYRSIAIGINRYHFLQPLSYAQADARALHQFLGGEGQLPPEQFLLLTDTSAWVEEQSTYPNRENILNWLNHPDSHKRNQADTNQHFIRSSVLWFFFSGYGVNYNGEDYLMPIDGNPRDIPGTGIEIRSLFKYLQEQDASQILVILDMNRSVMGGTTVGQKTIALAREMGIAVVLSTQPHEFSYEAATLGHGMFTAALLEALRYYRTKLTLANLDKYLRDRLPELSEHHWRPVQTPVTISPTLEASQQLILPSVERNPMNWEKISGVDASVTSFRVESINNSQAVSNQITSSAAIAALALIAEPNTSVPSTSLTIPSDRDFKDQILITEAKRSPSVPEKTPPLHWFLLGGGAALALAIIIPKIFGFNNQNAVTTEPSSEPPATVASPTAPVAPTASPNPQPVASTPSSAEIDANRDLLNSARIYLQSNQASGFNQAISKARKVEPDASLYPEAKADIARWSQIILDIAQGRAKEGDFAGAIAAAQLIPPDQVSVYAIAQQEIEPWKIKAKQQQTNQVLIKAAKGLINPTQASSYNRAITTLGQVPPGEPGYQEAQKLITQWSRQIYLIANSRAAKGNFKQAIQTAALIPKDTPSYEAAKAAIAKWKKGNR
ncbi:MAG: caspase domain-containing protein [Xenococcaceae cyanobacterium]